MAHKNKKKFQPNRNINQKTETQQVSSPVEETTEEIVHDEVMEATDTDTTSADTSFTEPETPKTTTELVSQLSQQFNLLLILLVALFLFQIFTFYKLKKMEGGNVAGAQQQQGPSPLSIENLKQYAKDFKLDMGKFNKCLDDGQKKAIVEADTKQGGDLGVQGTPGFFINGRFLGGAFPMECFKELIDHELAGTSSNFCGDYSENLRKYCEDEANQAFKPVPQEVAIGNAPMKGKKDAPVTIVEFSDFECPFCSRAFTTVQEIIKTYPNEVKIYYKHLPLTNIHPNAQKAAEASMCAGDQAKFWEYHDKLFSTQLQ